jgi:hypothetical protein
MLFFFHMLVAWFYRTYMVGRDGTRCTQPLLLKYCCCFNFASRILHASHSMADILCCFVIVWFAAVIDRMRAALWGVHIGDALAMPTHWYYDQGRIREAVGCNRLLYLLVERRVVHTHTHTHRHHDGASCLLALLPMV